jgi:hypothetical protein
VQPFGLSVLRLAEHYKAALGRERLDALIIQSVPDSSYDPDLLHRLLFRLPWADVFTTNLRCVLPGRFVVELKKRRRQIFDC